MGGDTDGNVSPGLPSSFSKSSDSRRRVAACNNAPHPGPTPAPTTPTTTTTTSGPDVLDDFTKKDASHCDFGAGYDHTGSDSLESCAASCKSTNCPCFDFREPSSTSNNVGCRVAKSGSVRPDTN